MGDKHSWKFVGVQRRLDVHALAHAARICCSRSGFSTEVVVFEAMRHANAVRGAQGYLHGGSLHRDCAGFKDEMKKKKNGDKAQRNAHSLDAQRSVGIELGYWRRVGNGESFEHCDENQTLPLLEVSIEHHSTPCHTVQ